MVEADEMAIIVNWPDGTTECRTAGAFISKNKRVKQPIQDGAEVLISDAFFAITTDGEIILRPYSEISELSFSTRLSYYECNPLT